MSLNPEDRRIIAQAIVETGYGTDSYDPETHECSHAAYASIIRIEMGGEWWEENYDTGAYAMDGRMHSDFDLPWDFEKYRLRVWSDGTKDYDKDISP